MFQVSLKLIFAIFLAHTIFNAHAGDKGFRYQDSSNVCMNDKGAIGYNPKYIGECGDFTKIRKRKIERKGLAGKNLKGAQFAGVDLSGISLRNTNLTGANLFGANLENTSLVYANVQKARINSETILPFPLLKAADKGMLIDGGVGKLSEVFDNPKDILKVTPEELDETLEKIKEVQNDTEAYAVELYTIVQNAEKLTVFNLEVLLKSAYQFKEEILKLSEKYPLAKNKEEQQEIKSAVEKATKITAVSNKILQTGIWKVGEISYEEFASLAVLLQVEQRQIGFGQEIPAVKFAYGKLVKDIDQLKNSDLAKNLMIHSNMVYSAATKAFVNKYADLKYGEDFNAESFKEIISLFPAENMFDTPKGESFENLVPRIGSLNEIELVEMANLFKERESQARVFVAGIDQINSLSLDNAKRFLRIAQYGSKDKIALRYMNLVQEISFDDAKVIFRGAYSEKTSVAITALNKMDKVLATHAIYFANKLDYSAKDQVIKEYFELVPSITTEEIVSLVSSAYSEKQALAVSNLSKVSDLSPNTVVQINKGLRFSAKDNVALKFIEVINEIDTEGLSAIVNSAYNSKSSLIESAFPMVSDKSAENVVILMNLVRYSSKDKIMKLYLDSVSEVSSSGLVALIKNGYSESESYGVEYFGLVSDKSFENVKMIMNQVSYGKKDSIGDSFLDSLENFNQSDLISLIRVSYQNKQDRFVRNYKKIKDKSFNNIVSAVNTVSYGKKDLVLEIFMKEKKVFTTEEIIALSKMSYNDKKEILMNNLSQVTDLSVENILKISERLTYGDKDTVIYSFLEIQTPNDVASILKLHDEVYNKKKEFMKKMIPLMSDLTVGAAINISKKYSYQTKDEFLLLMIPYIVDLDNDSLVSYANEAYTDNAKAEILKKGLSFLE